MRSYWDYANYDQYDSEALVHIQMNHAQWEQFGKLFPFAKR